jgi:TfoX N-terminal domain
MAFDETRAARLRAVMADRDEVSERQMFGGLTFLLGGHMCCGVHGDELILRLDVTAPPSARRAAGPPDGPHGPPAARVRHGASRGIGRRRTATLGGTRTRVRSRSSAQELTHASLPLTPFMVAVASVSLGTQERASPRETNPLALRTNLSSGSERLEHQLSSCSRVKGGRRPDARVGRPRKRYRGRHRLLQPLR